METRRVLADLAAHWHDTCGIALRLEPVGGVDAAGHVRADSLTPLARSGVAVAVRAGADLPDITTETALQAAVMSALTVGHSTGPSSTHLLRMFERWGVLDEIRGRIVQAPPGVPVALLVAQGDVALGFQQLSELLGAPGIEIVGPLPESVQTVTVFSGAVCSSTQMPDAARSWLHFMASPAADAVKRRHGMSPARPDC